MLRPTPSRSGFHPTRAKGQCFIKDVSVVERIVASLKVRPDDVFLEIGAGSGELTVPLAQTGVARLLAVEPEPFLANRLREAREAKQLQQIEIIETDFLNLDLTSFLAERDLPLVRVVGNLPYSAASPMLLKLLAIRNRLVDMTLMFQQEVAERIVAHPSTKAYGYLSVRVQQATRPRVLFRIPPQAFRPRPKVHSALVRMEPRGETELPVTEPLAFQALVKALLAHRRKNISNNLKQLQSPLLDEPTVRQGLEQLGINPTRRAESLTVEEFTTLARFCASRR